MIREMLASAQVHHELVKNSCKDMGPVVQSSIELILDQ